MSAPPPLIYLIATEASGDRLGAALMRACIKRSDGAVRFVGVGGQVMTQAGLTSLFPIEEFSIIGFAAIIRNAPHIWRRIRDTARAVVAAAPDALVIIDSPEFTHRVARRVRAMQPKLPIIDYVSPSVWAWRPGRAPAMRRYIDEVMALFPFEPDVHRRLGGPPCAYVGHPLAEEVALLRPNAEEARRRDSAPPVLLLLPGSRRSEVQNLLPVFRAAADRVAAEFPSIDVIIPTVAWLRETVEAAVGDWAMRPRVIVDQAEKNAAFRVARAALAASGTVTLELALAGVPSVVAYKVSLAEEIVARALINASSMVLANLVLDANVMPEFVQRDVTAKTLGNALIALLRDTPARQRQLDAFAKLDTIMQIGGAAPSVRAAEIVLRTAISAAK